MSNQRLTVSPAEMHRAETEAKTAHDALYRQFGQLNSLLSVVWTHYQNEARQAAMRAAPEEERLALAGEAKTMMNRIAHIDGAARAAIGAIEGMRLYAPEMWILRPDLVVTHPAYAHWVPLAETALAESFPDVWAFIGKARVLAAERAAFIDAAHATQRKALEANAPGDLVARLQAAGVALDVDRQGNIVAPAGSSLVAQERDQLARYKPEVVAILKAQAIARAEAARPVVLA